MAEGRSIPPDPPLIIPLGQLSAAPSPEAGQEKELQALLDGYVRTLPSERRHLLRHYRPVPSLRQLPHLHDTQSQ
jgi:hypothetical protein